MDLFRAPYRGGPVPFFVSALLIVPQSSFRHRAGTALLFGGKSSIAVCSQVLAVELRRSELVDRFGLDPLLGSSLAPRD